MKQQTTVIFVIIQITIVFTFCDALAHAMAENQLPNEEKEVIQEKIYHPDSVDVAPSPVKGMEDLFRQWRLHAVYPANAISKKVQGKVFIEFIVDRQGRLRDPKVLQGIGFGCDEAAVEALVKSKIKWNLAKKDGKPVAVRMVLPFTFKLT